MADQLVFAPFAIALGAAILALVARNHRRVQHGVVAAGLSTYGIAAAFLASRTLAGETLVYQLSSWPAPYGITLVADGLSGLMVMLSAVVAIPSFIYAASSEEYGSAFPTVFMLMVTGITGAFLTGDLFNLFVWFEVTLMSSYILVAYQGGIHETKSALEYLAVNLVGSSFMLVAIGGIYSTMGTLNMADLSRRMADPSSYGASPEAALGFFGILFAVFGLKAGMAPFHFWVPDAYRAAPSSVAAMMSGVAKKVGVYAILRIYFGVISTSSLTVSFAWATYSITHLFGALALGMASISILVGGLGAFGRGRLDTMLAYSSIGQVGFIVIPVGVGALTGSMPLALAASIIYLLNHGVGKSMLFLTSGAVEKVAGSQKFSQLSGLSYTIPLVSVAFFIEAISLIGIPPTLGFFGKLSVFISASSIAPVLILTVFGGLLTILYFSKAWNEVFWGEKRDYEEELARTASIAIALLALTLLLGGIGFEFVNSWADTAAHSLIEQESYNQAVLGGDSR